MDQIGKVQGAAAEKYPEFSYRVPVINKVDSHFVYEFQRLYVDKEYPCYTKPPSCATAEAVKLLNYQVVCETSKQGFDIVEVWLLCNEYTLAKQNRLVHSFNVTNVLLHDRHYIDEALRKVFD